MYTRHFALDAEPFSLTPDPSFLYLSSGHAEALAALKIGLQSRRGLMVMTGEVGTGKTTLLYSLLDSLGSDVCTAYVSNTRLTFDQILAQALRDFGVECEATDRAVRLAALNTFLLDCAERGATAALIIDEAQNLDEDVFESLRLLSNVETFSAKLLQIVLVGQPELDAVLAEPSLRQVAERVAVRCHVNPLSWGECQRYISHRLERVGGSSTLFTSAARRLVIRKSRGLPRRINITCHNALLFAYGRGEDRVSIRSVRAAVREREGHGLVTVGRSERRASLLPTALASLRWGAPSLAGAAVILAVTGVVAAGLLSSSVWTRKAVTSSSAGAPALASEEHFSAPHASFSSPAHGRPVLEVETSYGRNRRG